MSGGGGPARRSAAAEHRFDVVAVGIEDEGGVVPRGIAKRDVAQAGGAIVGAAGLQCMRFGAGRSRQVRPPQVIA